MYILKNAEGLAIEAADCIYDFNYRLEKPFAEPQDGDWHSLDDGIKNALKLEGFTIEERFKNPMIDDNYTGNDTQIDDLKEAVRDLAAALSWCVAWIETDQAKLGIKNSKILNDAREALNRVNED